MPFVEAETDNDLAFALGLVHAHLRLGQIRVLKQMVQGRLSEITGPGGHDADYSLRIVDIGRAAPGNGQKAEPRGPRILDSFLAGLNYYQAHMMVLPPEFALLGLDPEPFTVKDLVVIGRPGNIDVYWSIYIGNADIFQSRDHLPAPEPAPVKTKELMRCPAGDKTIATANGLLHQGGKKISVSADKGRGRFEIVDSFGGVENLATKKF